MEGRKQDEARFHDEERFEHRDENPDSASNRRFYEATSDARSHIRGWIERYAPKGIFLDYACGHGSETINAARAGAPLAVGIDISEVSIANARELAGAAGYAETTRFLQRDCEATGFPDEVFSSCLCSGMLHHLDLSRALPELHRIMAPGGRVFCFEALSYNPVIQAYRKRTPQLRTQWEKDHILSMREVRLAERWFSAENLRFFNLAAPLATLLPAGPLRKACLQIGRLLDSALTRIPFVQLWSWTFSFELIKRD